MHILLAFLFKTTNEQGRSINDMRTQWQRFFQENILDQIPAKKNDDIIALYTDYEGDHAKPYTAVLGCEVLAHDEIPEGMVHRVIPAGSYAIFSVEGALPDGVVATWQKIWQEPLTRTYIADFERYGCDSATGEKSATIYVGVTK